jgi:hypothetical protein
MTGLYVALADLHNLAGWICFDAGLLAGAYTHFQHALRLAHQGDHDALIANVHYRIGRVHLHHHDPAEALTQFQLGQAAARSAARSTPSRSSTPTKPGPTPRWAWRGQALGLLDQCRGAFVAAGLTRTAGWAAFFNEVDLSAMVGTAHAELAQTVHTRYTRSVIPALSHATHPLHR